MIAAAAFDITTRRIPNGLTVTACIFGLAIGYFATGLNGVFGAVAGFAVGLLLLMPGFMLRFTGGGDVKLLAGIGSIAGVGPVLEIFAISVLLGAGGVVCWGLLNCLRGASASPLRRYLDMVRVFFATGRVSYVRPQPGEAAATRVPLAPIVAIGSILVGFEVINFNELL